MEEKAQAATEPIAKFRTSIDAARCILLSQCGPALSRELCGMTEPTRLRAAASKALAHIERAEAAVEKASLGDDAAGEAQECVDLLRTFAAVFNVLDAAPTSDPARDEMLAACAGLAAYFDDTRTGIAEAAKLWQGVAYRRAGKPGRALQVLRPAITVPTPRRICFWARLERCRALGDHGDHAAALALSLRLSARVDAWFEEEDRSTRQQAADSVRWIRIELLRDWARHLEKEGLKDRAKEAKADADQLLASDPWPAAEDRWLSLGPPLADLPDCHVEATSQPSKTP